MLARTIVITTVLVSLTRAADWRQVSCDKIIGIGLSTYGKFCDLEPVSVVCALRGGDLRSKVFDNECHLKIANCEAEVFRKANKYPAGQIPSYAQDYQKTTQTSKCANYDKAYCDATQSCDGAKQEKTCGSDGKTYNRICDLNRASCLAKRRGEKRLFRVKSDGLATGHLDDKH
ncbi:agrin-like [Watersipora subatra]|uniref:agrin-like n=1 Tax=Watersipora subatra TaxID=2589382 RepID=UPI00355B16C5